MKGSRSQSVPMLVLALALVLAAPAVAAADDAPEAMPPTPFGEVLDVRVVNVEVVVTDRLGRRVEGLSADDFRLLVDGEEVPVDYFSEVRDGRIADASEGAAAAPASLDEEVPTQVLVFVDDAFAIARDRDRVLARLAADLGALGAGDRVAVVAFDGRRVDPLLDWSGDGEAIAEALAAAAERPAYGLRPVVRSLDRTGFSSFTRGGGRTLGDLELDGELERLVSAGVAAMRSAGRPDGRRVMLLLSGGWPFFPFGAFAGGGPDLTALRVRGDEMFAPLVDAANLLGYTLYPVDVPGLEPADTISAEHAQPRPADLYGIEEQSHDTLYHLARETGGRAMINGLRSDALPRMAADVASYYWLGFAPDRRGDDRRHELRVEVRGRGLSVRARDSYFDLSRQAAQAMTLEGTLLFERSDLGGGATGDTEGGTWSQGGLEVELGEARRTGRRVAQVPVRVSFPVAALEAVPVGEGGWRMSGELRVAALDGSSRLSRVPMVPISLDLAEPPAPGERVTWEGVLALRRVDQVVAVSLADPLSGRVLTSRLEASP